MNKRTVASILSLVMILSNTISALAAEKTVPVLPNEQGYLIEVLPDGSTQAYEVVDGVAKVVQDGEIGVLRYTLIQSFSYSCNVRSGKVQISVAVTSQGYQATYSYVQGTLYKLIDGNWESVDSYSGTGTSSASVSAGTYTARSGEYFYLAAYGYVYSPTLGSESASKNTSIANG